MPDALPPVGVLLSALDAATLPLAGTEEAFVMQGGQPRRTPVSSIGSPPPYIALSDYSPTITPANGTCAAAVPMKVTRMGPGPGPLSGDTVRVRGILSFGTASETPVEVSGSFPMPFPAALAAFNKTAESMSLEYLSNRVFAYIVLPGFDAMIVQAEVADGGPPFNVTFEFVYTAA